MQCEYLHTEPFKMRYALAAYLVKDCEQVIEIGGRQPSFSDFAYGPHKRIVILDRRMQPPEALPAVPFQDGEGDPESDFGIVMMGMDLDLPESGWKRLYELIDRSRRTVIEIPTDELPSVQQLGQIVQRVNKQITLAVGLSLAGNDFGDLTSGSPPPCNRRIFVLEGSAH